MMYPSIQSTSGMKRYSIAESLIFSHYSNKMQYELSLNSGVAGQAGGVFKWRIPWWTYRECQA
ncbi:hypothetical protein MKY92_03255 [Paenibacillus sp. FSL R5-0623]|uniref:hypothetical protein n=1 Tax=Paenibacillus sp. FSL R5-0623 TaxID=2921651 RepID=UPI0030DB3D91